MLITPSGKQPCYFARRDGQIITIAGLGSKWTDKATGTDLHSCTMVITEPNKLAAEVHDRMPVILEAKEFRAMGHSDVLAASADACGRRRVAEMVIGTLLPANISIDVRGLWRGIIHAAAPFAVRV